MFIIYGDHVSNASLIADQYVRINPAIEVASIENTKHLPQLEASDQVLEYINLFLS